MADTICGDCKRITEVVFDHSSGDTVCAECGLVLESHSIDETSEWRTFADSANTDDPNRVGAPTNPVLSNHLTTVISAAPSAGARPSSALNKRATSSDTDSHLICAFQTMAAMADRLSLVPVIKDRANQIYKKVLEDSGKSAIRGRNQDALLAACLYVACNQEQLPRTVKEICSVANGATKKELGRAKSYIMKQLHQAEFSGMGRAIRASDFVKRFCSNLGITNVRVTKAAQEAAQKAEEEVDVRRSPVSVAAAVIYMISHVTIDENEEMKMKTLKEISMATGVAEVTIRNAFKDLYPHVSRIVPSWFANEEALKNLSAL